MKTTTSFKIQHCNGFISGKNGFSFDTDEEAIQEAKDFKENPRCQSENMSDEDVEYWKTQTFTVIKEVLIVDEIETI